MTCLVIFAFIVCKRGRKVWPELRRAPFYYHTSKQFFFIRYTGRRVETSRSVTQKVERRNWKESQKEKKNQIMKRRTIQVLVWSTKAFFRTTSLLVWWRYVCSRQFVPSKGFSWKVWFESSDSHCKGNAANLINLILLIQEYKVFKVHREDI